MKRAAVVLSFFLLLPPLTFAQSYFFGHVSLRQDLALAKPSEIHWRRIVPSRQQQPESLFAALSQFGKSSDEDRLLRAQGYVRSFYFEYRSFSYEKDFFNVYKGVTLRKFWDGLFDVGVYKHHVNQGNLFGPSNAPPPAPNRLELTIRWNLARY